MDTKTATTAGPSMRWSRIPAMAIFLAVLILFVSLGACTTDRNAPGESWVATWGSSPLSSS